MHGPGRDREPDADAEPDDEDDDLSDFEPDHDNEPCDFEGTLPYTENYSAVVAPADHNPVVYAGTALVGPDAGKPESAVAMMPSYVPAGGER